jgi:hypothetical protein
MCDESSYIQMSGKPTIVSTIRLVLVNNDTG